MTERASQVAAVIDGLEENLELLCITGVEDQLQVCQLLTKGFNIFPHSSVYVFFLSSSICCSSLRSFCSLSHSHILFLPVQVNVRPTLELLRNAGIKVCTPLLAAASLHTCTYTGCTVYVESICLLLHVCAGVDVDG